MKKVFRFLVFDIKIIEMRHILLEKRAENVTMKIKS